MIGLIGHFNITSLLSYNRMSIAQHVSTCHHRTLSCTGTHQRLLVPIAPSGDTSARGSEKVNTEVTVPAAWRFGENAVLGSRRPVLLRRTALPFLQIHGPSWAIGQRPRFSMRMSYRPSSTRPHRAPNGRRRGSGSGI